MSAVGSVRVVARPDLGPWTAAWDDLVDRMPLPSPFLRSWWLGHVAAGEPVFVLVVDGEELLGGIALQRSVRHGCELIELLGDGPLEPDHLDLVADVRHVGPVSRAVGDWLSRRGNRVVDLAGLVDASWVVAALPRRTEVSRLQWAPYAPLPSDHAQYLAARSGQVRSTISRTGKRLAKAGVEVRTRPASEVDAALEDLRRLHDARWGERSGFLDSWPSFSAAVREGAAEGAVRFADLVEADGRVVAIELDLCSAGRWSFYQAGRLDERELRGSGSVLKSAVIQAAIAAGATEYDLLRGDERYKDEWATERRPVVRARVGFGPKGIALAAAAAANRQVQLAKARRAAGGIS